MTTPLIRRLKLQSFLSFGPEGVSVDLLPLNVLIGPNASGKSNLLEALSLLRATPGDLQAAIREGGGIAEYLWKGPEISEVTHIQARVESPDGKHPYLHYTIGLAQVGNRLDIRYESIGGVEELAKIATEEIFVAYHGLATVFVRKPDGDLEEVPVADLRSNQSILSQRKDPDRYPEMTFLGEKYGKISLFREWNFGARSPVRFPQATDLPTDFLLPDGSNLGLILHDIGQSSAKREGLISYLRRFYDPARHLSTRIAGGTLQLFIEEEGGHLIPATRLSDGTLRYLCLLAILLHPNPPPVIGIEEPELGLHPDIMPTIAELLKKASERTQLFVTTHSDALVSALSDTPESILVCESMPNGTTMKRLEPERLRTWLDEYTLGDVWRMGALGGNRW